MIVRINSSHIVIQTKQLCSICIRVAPLTSNTEKLNNFQKQSKPYQKKHWFARKYKYQRHAHKLQKANITKSVARESHAKLRDTQRTSSTHHSIIKTLQSYYSRQLHREQEVEVQRNHYIEQKVDDSYSRLQIQGLILVQIVPLNFYSQR